MGDEGAFLDKIPVGWALLATAVFVVLNGFFVAAEFSLVKVRTIRIDAMARKGHSQALLVQKILGRLDTYLSSCQLGITLSSLILGWLAEPAIAQLLLRVAGWVGLPVQESAALHFVALGLALSVVTVLHMTVGEQAPKIWAIQRAETMAVRVAMPLRLFTLAFRPAIWLVNSLSNGLLWLGGLSGDIAHEGIHDVDELRAILHSATRAGHISRGQRTLGENVLKLMGLQVRHVLVPRTDIVVLSTEATIAENLDTIKQSRHTRLPLCEGDLDHTVGVVHAKDVLASLIDRPDELDLRLLVRRLPAIPDTQPLSRMIVDCQKEQIQCALVVDEHGTSVGMAFLEDALEEIVGPIYDEFDQKVTDWVRVSETTVDVAGALPLPEAAELLDLDPDTEDDTIAGFVVSTLGRIPESGEVLDIPPYKVTVLAMSRRRIQRLRFETATDNPAEDAQPPTPQ